MNLVHLFRRPHYRSDVTSFIDELKSRDPLLEGRQRDGRSLLWDRPVDRSFQANARQARVPQKPYVYQTGGDSAP